MIGSCGGLRTENSQWGRGGELTATVPATGSGLIIVLKLIIDESRLHHSDRPGCTFSVSDFELLCTSLALTNFDTKKFMMFDVVSR